MFFSYVIKITVVYIDFKIAIIPTHCKNLNCYIFWWIPCNLILVFVLKGQTNFDLFCMVIAKAYQYIQTNVYKFPREINEM